MWFSLLDFASYCINVSPEAEMADHHGTPNPFISSVFCVHLV